jgi:hypothetical protein
MNAYTLFQTIHGCGRDAQYVDVLNALAAKGCQPVDGHNLLQNLLEEGFIKGRLGAYERISLTPKGLAHLQELEDLAEQNAKNKSRNAFEKKFAILGCLIPSVIAIIGILFDNWDIIVSFIRSLFH